MVEDLERVTLVVRGRLIFRARRITEDRVPRTDTRVTKPLDVVEVRILILRAVA